MEKLSEKKWDEFVLDDIFTVGAGKRLETRNKIEGMRPFIGATDNGNGVTGFVGNDNASKDSNVLGVNYNGAPCIAFYHPYECIFTDDVKRLHLKNQEDNKFVLLFFTSIFAMQRVKYSYGYKFKEKRMHRQKLMLPVDDKGKPDYAYMTHYSTEMRGGMHMRYKNFIAGQLSQLEHKDIPALNEKEWKKFKAFGDDGIFDIAATSSSIDGIRLKDGRKKNLPYVTRTDNSNGIAHFVSSENLFYGYDPAGCITVGLDTQTAFWQPHYFVTGQNIQVISGNKLNQYLAHFIVPLLRSQMTAKFNWGGNGATLGRMKRLEIMLPVTDADRPDYEYMEQYVKNMMLHKYEQYLGFIERQSSAEEVDS